MPDPFDGYQFAAYLRARWRLPAAVVAIAMAVSLAASLLVSKRYTASVSLVIDPPGASDPRAATAVSPVYLESLKTYEHFASSDDLFSRAVDRFQLRSLEHPRSIESLKRDVLQIEIPRNTKILNISITLGDARKAHDVAQFIAEETVKLNRATNRAGDDELIGEARKSAEAAAARLADAETARNRFQRQEPSLDDLKAQLEQLRSLRDEVDRLTLSAELTAAEQEARQGSATESSEAVARLQAARNRVAQLRRQASELDRQTAAKQQALAGRTAESERLEAAYDTAWSERDQFDKRSRELQGAIGYRGERLSLIDPGVVPERPSFPNIPLNLVVAVALGFIASIFWLTAEFSLRSQRAESVRKVLRVAGKP